MTSEELTHASVRSVLGLDREATIDFSEVRLSGRSLTIQPGPAVPRLDTGVDSIVELSKEGLNRNKLNVLLNSKPTFQEMAHAVRVKTAAQRLGGQS